LLVTLLPFLAGKESGLICGDHLLVHDDDQTHLYAICS
jgi:hypothetical protein